MPLICFVRRPGIVRCLVLPRPALLFFVYDDEQTRPCNQPTVFLPTPPSRFSPQHCRCRFRPEHQPQHTPHHAPHLLPLTCPSTPPFSTRPPGDSVSHPSFLISPSQPASQALIPAAAFAVQGSSQQQVGPAYWCPAPTHCLYASMLPFDATHPPSYHPPAWPRPAIECMLLLSLHTL